MKTIEIVSHFVNTTNSILDLCNEIERVCGIKPLYIDFDKDYDSGTIVVSNVKDRYDKASLEFKCVGKPSRFYEIDAYTVVITTAY